MALARTVGDLLAAAGIGYQIESQGPHIDAAIIGTTPDASIDLKIPPKDFIRARDVLETYYEKHLQNVDPDYYLYEFTDQELMEILEKPDEWGAFDYVLARKLLLEHGHPITKEFTDELKAKRLRNLAGFEDSVSPAGGGPLGAATTGYLGAIAAGFITATHKKTLPDGSQVPAFSPTARKRGWIFFIIGAIICALILFRFLFGSHR